MKRLTDLIATSAEEWGVPRQVAKVLFWTPIIGGLIMALSRIDIGLYRFFLRDDGPVEWAQFNAFAIACIAGAGIAIRRFKAGYKWQALLFVGFAVAMFFVSGEEIAWGQRLLGIETPEELVEINKQEEITLHNIGEILTTFNVVMMMGGALGSIAYLLNKKLRLGQYWDQADYLFVPPFFLASSFFFVFVYKFFRFTLWPDSGFTITKYGEWAEFCLAFGIGAFILLNYRRLSTVVPPVVWWRRPLNLIQKVKLSIYGFFNRNSN